MRLINCNRLKWHIQAEKDKDIKCNQAGVKEIGQQSLWRITTRNVEFDAEQSLLFLALALSLCMRQIAILCA